MNLTREEKETIVGRARTLHERIDHPATSGDVVADPEQWMTEWCERVADGDPQRFSKRLERIGLTRTDCRARIRRHGWPSAKSLPEWVDRLDELLQFVATQGSTGIGSEKAANRPFAPLLAPIVTYASTCLDHSTLSHHLSDGARDDLMEVLYTRIEAFCAHPLFIEFKTFIARRAPSLVFDDTPEKQEPSRRYYEQFIDEMSSGRLKEFFTEYAFLARLVGTIIAQWKAMITEFSERLDNDYDRLVATFSTGTSLGDVTAIESRGEPHHCGRYVLRLTLETGTSIAYKPRPLAVEEAFNDVLTWVNTTTDVPSFQTPTYLSRDGYGWMEWITTEPCATTADVQQYYRRAGMLIAILYSFNFSDGNLENIIAAGEHPVLIDGETLAQPDAADTKLPVAGNIRQTLLDSVLRTGVVPLERPTDDVQEASGFGSHQALSTEAERREFHHINTDLMELTYQEGAAIEGDNLPTRGETVIPPDEHVEAICDGFDGMYQFLQHQMEQPDQAVGPPLARFADIDIRVLFRSTTIYAKILTLMTTPAYLRTGLPFGCKVEALAKPLLTDADTDAVWQLYDSERTALRRCDFPRFEATTTSTAIRGEEGTIEEFFEMTGYQRVCQRLTSLTAMDRHEQRRYLEWGFGGASYVRSPSETEPVIDDTVDTTALEAQCRRQARAVFDRLRASAHDDGQTWIHRKCQREGGVSLQATPPALYTGRIGIALFGAALASVFEERRYHEFVTTVVAPLMEQQPEELSDYGIGGGTGLGSIIYGLTKLGTILDNDSYLSAARECAPTLTDTRIAADERYDVIDGSAGAVLGLLALYDATGDTEALQTAVLAGDHLLEASTTENKVPIWPSPSRCALTGFGHGTAGIAYALMRLADVTDEHRFREVATASLDYEERHYEPAEYNWRDLRPETETDFMDAWCHGRSGIGLARLGMVESMETASIQRDIDRALRGVDPSVLQTHDHVCCGNGARIGFLLKAAQSRSEPKYREQATHLLAATLQRLPEQGQFRTRWQTDQWYNPGFFQGEAGIGYLLLRVLDPSLPCALLWE